MSENLQNKKIKIAVDTSMMDGRLGKGTATVIRENLKRFSDYKDKIDFTLVHKFKTDDEIYKNFDEIVIPRIWNFFAGGVINELLFFLNYRLQILLGKKEKFDIYFVAYSRILPFFFLAPAKKFVFYPMDGGPKTANYKLEKVKTPFPWFVRLFKSKIDLCFAISNFGKRGIVNEIGIPDEKVKVIYCDAPENFKPNLEKTEAKKFLKEKYNYPGEYIVSVSRWDPHKNTFGLVEAYSNYRKLSKNPKPLLFVGGKHMPEYSARVDRKIEELGLKDFVIMSKYVEEKDLPLAYFCAKFMIFPSFYEGFGIPVVEAQRSFCPVLISSDQALVEVAGSGAIICNPYDVEDMTRKILALDESAELKKYLIEEGTKNQNRFSWDKSTRQLIESLIELNNKK